MLSRPTLPGRHPSDREILRLAVPALGALAAEPLYVLTDTAVVGHLGTPQLGGLAVAGTILTTAFTLFNFLSYGTTAAVARAAGAGRSEQTAANAVQSLWLALVPLFSDDPAVAGLTGRSLWVVAVLQPRNAVVFVLDGVLIGAADLRFLAGAMVVAFALFLPAAVAAGVLGGTLLWLWGAVALLMLARLAGVGWRFAGPAWAVTGA